MNKILLSLILLSIQLLGSNLFLNKFFNNQQCDQVLNNSGYFKTCYDYKMKGAKYVAYSLDGSLVNKKNIKKRPRFFEDKNIPKRYRSHYSDYTHNIYKQDRGHIFEDAAMDYSQRSLNAIYTMSNIIPQHRTVNRSQKAWAGLERFGRTLATKMGKINVLNGIVYSKHPKRIGRNKIAVPSAFWKMFYSKEQNYQRCFYFENTKITDKSKKVKDYEVSCKKLLRSIK